MSGMHVALLANTSWLDEELWSFHYLLVGLIDEQVNVVQLVPQYLPMDEANLLGQRLTWHESRLARVNRYRIARLADSLRGHGINLVHALDGHTWRGAVALANSADSAAVFSACSESDLNLVAGTARLMNPSRIGFIASTERLSRAIRKIVSSDVLVETIGTGVPVVEERSPRLVEGAFCGVVCGNGECDDAYESLLDALTMICRDHPQTQFFFDGQVQEQHAIWTAAAQRGLLTNVSLVPRRLGHREILLGADVLIHPQTLGRSRSITLQAMAHGVPVVAMQDPCLDYLVDQKTAWVMQTGDTDQWISCLSSLIREPELGWKLGRSGQNWIRQNRTASVHIASILRLYRRLTGSTLEFPLKFSGQLNHADRSHD